MLKTFVLKTIRSALLLLTLASCGSGGGGETTPSSGNYRISLDFTRIDTSTPYPFQVIAAVSKNGAPQTGLAEVLQIEVGRGSLSAVNEISPGQYQFTVNPTQTGEHSVKVSYENASVERTALVMDNVNSDWGQPMAVAGLVNTAGYEDGVTISPDGEYLFVQYGPLYFSVFQLFSLPRDSSDCGDQRLSPTRCTHPWLDNTIGPYTAPQRSGFYDGRFSGTTNLHNANSWGVGMDESPIFAPSTMIYGFKRQADGSFAQPFYLSFDDENDAIINASGLSLMPHGDGTATIVFALDDPADTDLVDLAGDGSIYVQSLHDIYTTEISFGENTILGTYVYSGSPGTPPVRSTPFASSLVDFGKTGTNGIAGT